MRHGTLALLGSAFLVSLQGCGTSAGPIDESDAGPTEDSGAARSCDEGATRPCEGECGPGTETCRNEEWGDCQDATDPIAETCNGQDDDCNGVVDDGPAESCNGVDDDCDGEVDEGLGGGEPCDADGDGCLDDAFACDASGELVCTEGAPQSDGSRMGIDYLLPFIDKYDDDQWAATYSALADAGVGWVNFADVSPEAIHWGEAAENAYWAKLDRSVLRWQRAGFRIAVSLRTRGLELEPVAEEILGAICGENADCREKFDCSSENLLDVDFCLGSDRLPLLDGEGHALEYRDWLATLVERYDCDGTDDAEGLVYPIRHFQIGNEYGNPVFWTGSIDEYGQLLAETRAAVPDDIVVISNGIRWNDLFHDHPDGASFEDLYQSQWQHILDSYGEIHASAWSWHRLFTEATIDFAGPDDVLDAGGNGPYPTATEGYMSWVNGRVPDPAPRVWDMESRAEPRLVCRDSLQAHCELTVADGAAVMDALWAETYGEPFDPQVLEWYRAEQAAILGQVLVERFAAGVGKVFVGQVSDWNDPAIDAIARWANENVFVGFLDSDKNPQAAFYAYELAARQLGGFSSVETLRSNRGAETAALEGDEIELHRFSFSGRSDVLVAWLAEEADHDTGISRGPHDASPHATLTLDDELGARPGADHCIYPTPTTAAPSTPQPVAADADGALAIDLGPAPVYIAAGPCP